MNKDKDKSKKKSEVLLNTLITIFTIAIIVLIGFLAYQYNKDKNSDENKLAYTDLVKEIQAGNVEKIEMTTGSMSLKVKMKDVEKEKTTIIPSVQVFSELVQQKVLEENNIELETKTPSILSQIPSYIFSILIPSNGCDKIRTFTFLLFFENSTIFSIKLPILILFEFFSLIIWSRPSKIM